MKEKIISFIKKNYFNIFCILIIIIMVVIVIFDAFLYFRIENKRSEIKMISDNTIIETQNNKEGSIKVEIKGMVNSPGVYSFSDDSRVIDAIESAGGLIEGANTDLLNLAKKLVDEMVIIIYSNDFINNYRENNKKIEYVYVEVESCPDTINKACINEYSENIKTDNQIESKNNIIETAEDKSNMKISINTASIEQLTTLSGIGKSKAEAIIKYREENGNFKDISEIKNVSGIGDSAFEKIKDNISI